MRQELMQSEEKLHPQKSLESFAGTYAILTI